MNLLVFPGHAHLSFGRIYKALKVLKFYSYLPVRTWWYFLVMHTCLLEEYLRDMLDLFVMMMWSDQTWGQLLINVTMTIKSIALHYNYRGFDNVMDYITITFQSNAITFQLL